MEQFNNYDDIRLPSGMIDLRKIEGKIKAKELNRKIYFKDNSTFKPQMSVKSPYNELIAEELAKDFGIECAHYEVAGLEEGGKRCFSEDFIGDKFAITFEDMQYSLWVNNPKFDERVTIELIRDMLEVFPKDVDESRIDSEDIEKYHKYKRSLTEEEINKVMDEVNKIYVFDVLIANSDNNPGNFGIMLDENGVTPIPSFDNEMILNNHAMSKGAFAMLPDSEVVKNKSDYSDPFDVIIHYFQKPENEKYADLFKDKLWIISEENIEDVIKRVETRTKTTIDENTKNEYKERFRKYNENLLDVMNYINDPLFGFK